MHDQDLFKDLNSNQISAIKATEGTVRVIAGAGSGKTRVLANRYAYLVNYIGIDPAHILCMTFTNKAAQEMKSRIRQMVDGGTANDYICTIHGLCVKILRKEIYRIGYPQSFTIVDTEDCKDLMKQVMQEQELIKQNITVNQLLADVSKNKATVDYIPYLLPDTQWPNDVSTSSFLRFIQLQRKYYALDFNDLIYITLYIFENYPDALDYWQKEFDYIQVDEVQDCSNTDWDIIDALSSHCGNLFIVGDPDQAIYEWRGAKPDKLVQFKAGTDIILNENYRSTPNILNVANSIIKHNVNRIEKSLSTSIAPNSVVIHKHAENEISEGKWVSSLINEMIKQGYKYSDFAILYRATFQSRFIEQALIQQKLPYTVWGGTRFFERKEIKDCIAYLRLIHNQDDISFKRIVNVPSRKFGEMKLKALTKLSEEEHQSLFNTLKKHIKEEPFNGKTIKDFVNLIDSLRLSISSLSVSDFLERVLEKTGLGNLYRNDGDQDRVENINELIQSIKYYEEINKDEEVTLENYLQDIALLTNLDYKKDCEAIKLMTIHQSKGLEFPYVFIIGLTEGIFPNYKTIRERKLSGLEEERRLMYVAITRAEKALFLTESEGYNYTTNGDKYPSRFISEISNDLIKVEGYIDPFLITKRDNIMSSLKTEIEESNRNFKIGDKVVHEVFGEGTILSVKPDKLSCEVQFSGKTRNIMWKFLEES